MITRLSLRSVCLLVVASYAAVVTASIRMDTASQEMAAISPQIAAAPASAAMDIAALTAKAGAAAMPVLSLRDPI